MAAFVRATSPINLAIPPQIVNGKKSDEAPPITTVQRRSVTIGPAQYVMPAAKPALTLPVDITRTVVTSTNSNDSTAATAAKDEEGFSSSEEGEEHNTNEPAVVKAQTAMPLIGRRVSWHPTIAQATLAQPRRVSLCSSTSSGIQEAAPRLSVTAVTHMPSNLSVRSVRSIRRVSIPNTPESRHYTGAISALSFGNPYVPMMPPILADGAAMPGMFYTAPAMKIGDPAPADHAAALAEARAQDQAAATAVAAAAAVVSPQGGDGLAPAPTLGPQGVGREEQAPLLLQHVPSPHGQLGLMLPQGMHQPPPIGYPGHMWHHHAPYGYYGGLHPHAPHAPHPQHAPHAPHSAHAPPAPAPHPAQPHPQPHPHAPPHPHAQVMHMPPHYMVPGIHGPPPTNGSPYMGMPLNQAPHMYQITPERVARATEAPGTSPEGGMRHRMAITTIMLRNIPQRYNREMLIEDLDKRGFAGAYDFFYLPIDFSTTHSVGYAFINFISEAELARFKSVYVGLKLSEDSPKVCEVCDAKVQGKVGNVEYYRNSTVMGMDEKYHPLLFEQGMRLPFPMPTRPLGAVQRRPPRAGGRV